MIRNTLLLLVLLLGRVGLANANQDFVLAHVGSNFSIIQSRSIMYIESSDGELRLIDPNVNRIQFPVWTVRNKFFYWANEVAVGTRLHSIEIYRCSIDFLPKLAHRENVIEIDLRASGPPIGRLMNESSIERVAILPVMAEFSGRLAGITIMEDDIHIYMYDESNGVFNYRVFQNKRWGKINSVKPVDVNRNFFIWEDNSGIWGIGLEPLATFRINDEIKPLEGVDVISLSSRVGARETHATFDDFLSKILEASKNSKFVLIDSLPPIVIFSEGVSDELFRPRIKNIIEKFQDDKNN